ncbi:MAG: hypothetical protein [Olavius algarvensis Gamma 1 endosymbiont]|nr:MAG: hypothetical protein [Olavius algarvensis Gamma 1 endosymbiont]
MGITILSTMIQGRLEKFKAPLNRRVILFSYDSFVEESRVVR